MSIIDSVKNTAFSTAVKTVMDYLEKDPEKKYSQGNEHDG